MDVTEKWGDSVDQAVDLALKEMKLSRDEVEVEVLEEPSKGFLGIVGQQLAKVRVTRKGAAEEIEEEEETKEEPEVSAEDEQKKERRWKKNTNKKPLSDLIDTDEELTPDPVLEDLDFHKKMRELPECDDHPAITFLKDVISDMGLDLEINAKADDTNVYIELSGADCGTIIGRRGATLDAIQYLTSLVVNKKHDEYIKVVIDAEDYRSRREKTLEQLANKMARKAVRSHRSMKLDPMNPYERKVIHATLQADSRVTTKSEGQDPYRRVVIEPKR